MKYKAIPWVQGNPLTLRIPLEKVIITPEGTQTTDYVPQEGDELVVSLKSERKTYEYTPEIEGNIAIITDESLLLVGLYDRVSGQLFGNAGTGAFVVGPDVNN